MYNHIYSSVLEIVATSSMGGGTIFGVCLLLIILCSGFSALAVFVFMKKRIVQRDIKNIGSPCYDSFPNQYSSLPTKDERPKVKRQSSFNANSAGANTKLLTNGTLPKSNNVTGHQTPKALAKNLMEDTATIKRNSHALNNVRPIRSTEDDKF